MNISQFNSLIQRLHAFFSPTFREELALQKEYGMTAAQLTFNTNTTFSLRQLDADILSLKDFQERDTPAIGYPKFSTDTLMAFFHGRIERLVGVSGLTPEMAQLHLIETIRRVVRFIHLIPASNGYHHKDCGGLLQHSLEVAYFANQRARCRYFTPLADGDKSLQQTKWTLAATLGGLCHDVGKVFSDVTIRSTKERGLKFEPAGGILSDWITEMPGDRYFVYWQGEAKHHEEALATLFADLISPETRAFLGGTVSLELSLFFRRKFRNPGESVLNDVITAADSESVGHNRTIGQFDRSISARPDRECSNFFAAVRRLLAIGADHCIETGDVYEVQINGLMLRGWSVNTPDGALLACENQRLFIFWDRLFAVRTLYDLENVSSRFISTDVRADPEEEILSLLEALDDNGYLELNVNGGDYRRMQYVWLIGRYDASHPQNRLFPERAVCLNAKAINCLFTEKASVPTPCSGYAVFQSVNDETGTLLLRDSAPDSTTSRPTASDPAPASPAPDDQPPTVDDPLPDIPPDTPMTGTELPESGDNLPQNVPPEPIPTEADPDVDNASPDVPIADATAQPSQAPASASETTDDETFDLQALMPTKKNPSPKHNTSEKTPPSSVQVPTTVDDAPSATTPAMSLTDAEADLPTDEHPDTTMPHSPASPDPAALSLDALCALIALALNGEEHAEDIAVESNASERWVSRRTFDELCRKHRLHSAQCITQLRMYSRFPLRIDGDRLLIKVTD